MPNFSLEMGDRIAVTGPTNTPIDTQGIFISLEGQQLTWVALGTVGPFAGLPTLFFTNLQGLTIQKLT
jgi:hypothetical protein